MIRYLLKLTDFRKGLKPLKILVEIYDHALKDVAIAPTFLPAVVRRWAGRGIEEPHKTPKGL